MIRSWIRIVVFCGVFAASPSLAESHHMVYEVYGSGFHLVSAEMTVTTGPAAGPAVGVVGDHYETGFTAYTRGLLGRLAPWRGSFFSEGRRDAQGAGLPLLHRSVAIWRGEEDSKEYRYDGKGGFLGFKKTGPDEDADVIEETMPDETLVQGTMDVMTAIRNALQRVGDGKDCTGSTDIFDGSRRFTLSFRREGEDELEPTRYNIFDGMAQRCVAEIEQGPGRWHRKPRGWISIQEQGRRAGSLPTVWFGKMSPDGPAIPVKVQVKSDYGAMMMHLVDYRIAE